MRALVSLALLLALVVGCGQTSPSESTDGTQPESPADGVTLVSTTNEVCPIMGGKVTADGGSAEWNGKTIGFCCAECVPEWEKLSGEDKEAKLAALDSEGEDSPEQGEGDPS